ncbi:molybdenum cofactor guanylyltransferase MobA [Anderseniella sp. Alg231-50]|uniref:molybdenum cofactor guanylyltransferase MobA n=1 Tax=Anderseniella sp. Alg231-50 TaxID=1922226 RepID=UPI000D55445C
MKIASIAAKGPAVNKVVGCILAGGLARRMGGGDKGLIELAGRPVLDHVIDRFGAQVGNVILNANGDPARFADYGLPVMPDTVEGFAGPLAGVLAGLSWAQEHAPDADWVATAATDTPFFPADFVTRLLAAIEDQGADMACAASHGRNHPVFGLWPVRLKDDLQSALVDEDIRKVDLWTARHKLVAVEFTASGFDPFFNVNRPDDVSEAERIAKGLAA